MDGNEFWLFHKDILKALVVGLKDQYPSEFTFDMLHDALVDLMLNLRNQRDNNSAMYYYLPREKSDDYAGE